MNHGIAKPPPLAGYPVSYLTILYLSLLVSS
jgi:hypothetical protein